MIVLDTNVVSELMRREPERAVLRWMQGVRDTEVALPAPGVAEILFGIRILPKGKRQTSLVERFAHFQGSLTVLPFGEQAAEMFAQIAAERRQAGEPISTVDCQIASIARVHGARIATRDTGGFRGCGVEIVNPWREVL